jgi:putative ABC transport system permease protein
MLSDLRYRLRALFRRNAVEDELQQELGFHFDQQVEKHVRAGMTRYEALRQTRLAFGGMDRIKDECREARGLAAAETLLQDIRHALRLWGRNPGFALAAVTAIGLGIGVNAAVFTITNAALFKTLPSERSGHTVYILGRQPGCELPCDTGRSYPDYRDFQAQAKSFDAIVAYHFAPVNLSDASSPERYPAMLISANGFSAFGQKPVAGRDFIPADERADAAPVAMLADALWQRRYGRDPSIIGKEIRVNDVSTTVIGVMPPDMQFRTGVDLWMPLAPVGDWQKREYRELTMLGRLAKNVSLKKARAELDTISRRLQSAYPAADKDIGTLVMEGRDYLNPRIRLVLMGLWIVVGLVLLVACANVANLLLGRAVERSREISIRIALGAGRGRVVRQLLAESVTLSTAGGVLGWLLAVWGVRAFDAALAGEKPPWLDFSMDYTVLGYLAAISIGSGILFGLAPALRLSRADVHAALRDGGHGASGGARGRYLSSLLVAGEMATAVVLLVGTVLVLRTLVTVYGASVGVNTANVLTMNVDLPTKKYPRQDDRRSFYERLQARLRALPGVAAVSIASTLPGHDGMSTAFELEGAGAVDRSLRPEVRGLVVDADYFRAMDVRPLVGREFSGADGVAGTPAVIVNRSFAAKHWPAGRPAGRRLRLVEDGAPREWLTVVGVVPDIWQNDQRRDLEPLIYLPFLERPLAGMSVVARTRVPPATLGQPFRREVQAIDGELPVFAMHTLDEEIRQHDWSVHVFGALFSIFAAIAMLLAAVGLYAVVAHSVNRRTQEIGVRLALGANAANIVGAVFAQGMRPVALGLGVGLAAAFGLARLLRALLAGLGQPDWATFAIVSLMLAAAGALACAIPARRATRVDPVVALRFE